MKRCFSIILSLALLLGMIPFASADTAPVYGGTLRIGEITNGGATYWRNLGAPQYSYTNHCLYHMYPAIETLGRQCGTDFEPLLATDWVFDEDALTYTLTIREGVKFQDGTDLNAEAVVWNLNQYLENMPSDLVNFKSFEATDAYTVVAHMSSAGLFAERQLLSCRITSPSYFEKMGGFENLVTNSCGTGPFILQSANVSEVVYTRNENYWGKDENGNQLPYLDEIRFVTFEDINTLTTALESGDVDAAYKYNNYANVEYLVDGDEILYNQNFLNVPYAQAYNLTFPDDLDESVSPFANKLVRQAACYAIDNDAMAMGMSSGLFSGATEWATVDSVLYSGGEVKNYPYDVEKAKALLKEAGYEDGCKITYVGANNARDNIAIAYLTAAGFDVTFEQQGNNKWLVGGSDPFVGVTMQAVGFDWNTDRAWFGAEPTWIQDRWPNQRERIVELYTKVINSTSEAEAQPYAVELSKLLIDDECLCVPLVAYNAPMLWRSNVQGAHFDEYMMWVWTPESAWKTR